MNDTYIIFAVVLGIALGFKVVVDLTKRSKKTKTFSNEVEEKPLYRLVWKFFNKSEEAFYLELKKDLPENYHIFSKVRLIDFIEPIKGVSYFSSRGKVWSRHVDFLICDFNFKPVLVIEVNGKSHQRKDRQNSDEFKKQLFEAVGVKYKFINVGESFESSIKVLVSKL